MQKSIFILGVFNPSICDADNRVSRPDTNWEYLDSTKRDSKQAHNMLKTMESLKR